MKKENILKLQFIAGLVFAYAIIIGSFIFYFLGQRNYNQQLVLIRAQFMTTSTLAHELEIELLKITHYKTLKYSGNASSTSNSLLDNHISRARDLLQKLNVPNILYDEKLPEIKQLNDLYDSVSSTNFHERNNNYSNESALDLLKLQREDIKNTSDRFATVLQKNTNNQAEAENKRQESNLNTIMPIGFLALIIILYIIYKIYLILEKVIEYSKKEKRINADFAIANKKIEDNNWILQRTNDIYAQISGIDKINQISEIGLKNIAEALADDFYAGAIYLRQPDTSKFDVVSTNGYPIDLSTHFEDGDGILGQVVKNNRPKIYSANKDRNIQLRTTFIENIASTVALIPLNYDNNVIGLLEILGNIDTQEQEKYLAYFKRAAQTMSSAIVFGQNHTVVHNLLEKTQKQTEELEAQQEELRITNEELVLKTNLLESSEEELRVQQEELSQTNKELNEKAEELHRRNAELNAAQRVVEEKIAEVELASNYKSEFMANMSHELRTPLNSILILARLLSDNKLKNLTEDQVKYASVIHSAGSDLLELINELLDLAKIESGKVEMNEENIISSNFVKNIDNLFKQIAIDRGIDFSIEKVNFPESFVTDEYRLEQVIKNFLSNAFKFTELNGKVTLRISNIDNTLKFEVSDTGKGISGEKQALIFEAFHQEDGSTSRKYGGTGLGLSISREIAHLLGGNITLQSEPGQGSTFGLNIPYKRTGIDASKEKRNTATRSSEVPQKITNAQKTESVRLNEPRSILIIEDDFNFADILKDFAESYGFIALLAYDGSSGISMAKKHTPDAIILDVMLPISDGWEVLKNLKSDPQTQHIPIHMMSAADHDPKEILEKGAIGFLPKPVSEENIKAAFSNIILNIDKEVKKVLLVEDQEVLSDYIKSTFAEHNINILQAFTLEAAYAKLEHEDNIDCVILDISLPDGNGLDLLEMLKDHEKLKNIPVIINTAEDLPAEQTEKIERYTKSMILKDGTSTNRLIDEVNLFLNKIHDSEYEPIRNAIQFEAKEFLPTSSLKGKKALIVDDDMRNVFALTTSLQEQEMEIEIANNGKDALELINDPNHQFDIVLMDIMMPEMDGHEAIEHIRKDKKHAKLPIIAITAKAMKGDRAKSIEIGANDYVSKPINMDKLISLMQVWLS